MKDEIREAAGKLGIPVNDNGSQKPPSTGNGPDADRPGQPDDPGIPVNDRISHDTIKRRGFFEAIGQVQCTQHHLSRLLNEYEQQARDKIKEADETATKRIDHLEGRIQLCRERILELQAKLVVAEQYSEANDADMQQLISEKAKEEAELLQLQQNVSKIRSKLGEAKAGIISKSLEEAELQVQKALSIQKNIYQETWRLSEQKFKDEKDHLTQLSVHFRELYEYYSIRHKKINKYLKVLDVDGISPVTTQILITIGTVAFGAAGFFFSTFAGYAGFGNQDVLSFVLGGLVESARQPATGMMKILTLLLLIALVTGVSVVCHWLINRLKSKSPEEILSEMEINAETAKKFERLEYSIRVRSNNWYAFWLQIIPGVLITGLILLSLSQSATKKDIYDINASSEGLIVGSAIAMALAGLIYLYIIKIVEPRLIRRYDSLPGTPVNWVSANWELVTILVLFILVSVCIIAIPYDIKGRSVAIPADQQTRYAILVFIGICLVGGMSFAYSVRSRGLIQTNWYVERVMRWLNLLIANCTAPKAPAIHNKVADEHGNIILHVLKQLSFKATLNSPLSINRKRKTKEKSFIDRLLHFVKTASEQGETQAPEPIKLITAIEPWEQHYFPHIVDDLKAAEFEYSEKQRKVMKAEYNISDYRLAKQTERRKYESDIEQCRKNITEYEAGIEDVIREQAEWRQKTRLSYDKIIVDLMDGFHLGMWYRENGMGPKTGYYEPCPPNQPAPLDLIISQ